MASYGGVVEGKVLVGIFTPAFSYPASLSHSATVKAALADLGLQEDECDFYKQEHGRLACVIKNNKFTLQYVEETYAHNKALIEQLQRAAEALVAFRTKVEEDALLINELKNQINNDNTAWEIKYEEEHELRKILQDKLEKLKTVVNSDHITEPSRPKIPKLQLTGMNGSHSEPLLVRPLTLPVPPSSSSTVSPRGVFATQDANTQTHTRYLASPRDSGQIHVQTQAYSSPRDSAQNHAHPPAFTNMNGKRSISSSNIGTFSPGPPSPSSSPTSITTSASSSFSSSTSSSPQFDPLSPHSKHSREPSPRSTLSPRGANPPGSPHGNTSPRTVASPRGLSSPRSSLQHVASLQHAASLQLQHAAHSGSVKEHLRRHSSNFGEDGHVRRFSNADVTQPTRSSSPRSKSSSEIPPHYFDLTQPFPDVHSLMPVVHSFSYGSSDSAISKRRSVASPIVHHSRARSEAQIDFPPAETLSQTKIGTRKKVERTPSLPSVKLDDIGPKSTTLSCRLCSCDKFRTSKAEWMCTCGHANIKHAVFLKASPAPSPTVSPRKYG